MFHELLDNPKRIEPGRLQKDARHLFPSAVKKSHFHERVAGSPIPSSGVYVIIGIATYSPQELRLLDDVDASYTKWEKTAKVAVFDVMECKSMNDISGFVPPFMVVCQTPIIALWDGGKLVVAQTGLRVAREALQDAGLLK